MHPPPGCAESRLHGRHTPTLSLASCERLHTQYTLTDHPRGERRPLAAWDPLLDEARCAWAVSGQDPALCRQVGAGVEEVL